MVRFSIRSGRYLSKPNAQRVLWRCPALKLILASITIAAIFPLLAGAAVPVKEVRRVLVLNTLGYLSSPGVARMDDEIVAALAKAPFQIELYSEDMEATLFPDETVQQQFRRWYIHKYRDRKPDVIIAVGLEPLKFMVEAHDKYFPDIPVIFCGTTREMLGQLRLGSDFTGVWAVPQPEKTLNAALRLQPDTEHVVVVGGVGEYDRHLEAIAKESFRKYESRFQFTYLIDLDMSSLVERLKRLPDHTIVYHTSIMEDASGTRFIDATQAVPMVADTANAPVFVVDDVDLGRGTVGGYLLSFHAIGQSVGEMAVRILNGEKPDHIPIVASPNIYMFDWRAIKRWGWKEKSLPPGSIVLNRQPTLWDSYKRYIVGGVCLLLAQTSLIVGLLWQWAIRRTAEAARKESEERFRLVANTAPVLIWMSGTDKFFNYFNNPWLDFTGRTLEQELGNGWAEGVHSEDLAECLKTYSDAFDKREQFDMEYRLRRKDGEYRWVLDIGVPRFSAEGSFAGYIGSCIDVTERKRAEEALASIGRRLIEAHEEERTWIGKELHDDINQRLAMLAIEMDQWSREESRAEFQEHLGHSKKRIMELSMDVQALSHRLHSSKLDYLGLVVAAASFCKEVSNNTKVDVHFSHAAVPSTIPKEVSLCLFRVLQEALQNAIKYSGVTLFHVNLCGTSDGLELTVSDEGRGFDEHDGPPGQGLGLISMRERLQMVSGALEIKAQLGAGTTVFARVPLQTANLRAKAG